MRSYALVLVLALGWSPAARAGLEVAVLRDVPRGAPRPFEVGPAFIGPEAWFDRNVFGTDDAVEVADPMAWPHVTAARLAVSWPGGRRTSCSGNLVGPNHVMTAGHCVYDVDTGEFADDIEVFVAWHDGVAPFGSAHATNLATFDTFMESGDSTADMGFVELDRAIGDLAGWMGVKALDEAAYEGRPAAITGYPGGDQSDARTMMTVQGTLVSADSLRVYYTLDTSTGSSGSGVWDPTDDCLYGAHATAYSIGGEATRNGGPRFTAARIADLAGFLGAAPPAPESVPDPPPSGHGPTDTASETPEPTPSDDPGEIVLSCDTGGPGPSIGLLVAALAALRSTRRTGTAAGSGPGGSA